ncbi:MAG: hypothetical protein JRF04_00430 [Deltaproteobacteria bacterium]|nr:hypothetical protein [Deltaproteobacteria bacterium]
MIIHKTYSQSWAKARADVRSWEAQLAETELTLKRLQHLVKKHATSQQKVNDAATADKAAREELVKKIHLPGETIEIYLPPSA